MAESEEGYRRPRSPFYGLMRGLQPLVLGAMAFLGSLAGTHSTTSHDPPQNTSAPLVIFIETTQPSHVKFVNPSARDEAVKDSNEKAREAVGQLLEDLVKSYHESLNKETPDSKPNPVQKVTPTPTIAPGFSPAKANSS